MKTITRACEHCGKSFEAPQYAVSIGRGRFCSLWCRAQVQNAGKKPSNAKPYVTLTCQVCAAAFAVPQRRATEAKCCSRACGNVLKSRTRGPTHPLYSTGAEQLIEMTCQWCGATVMRKRKLAPQFKFCSRTCTGAYSSSLWRREGRISSIEQRLITEMESRGIPFEHNPKIGKYRVDFAFRPQMLIVEADGDYWHGKRPKQLEADARKDVALGAAGWCVLRIRESAINADVSACGAQIMTLLQEREKRYNGSQDEEEGMEQTLFERQP